MAGRGTKAQQQKQKQKREQWRFSPLAFRKLESPSSEQPTKITRRRYPTPPRTSPFEERARQIPPMQPLPPPPPQPPLQESVAIPPLPPPLPPLPPVRNVKKEVAPQRQASPKKKIPLSSIFPAQTIEEERKHRLIE